MQINQKKLLRNISVSFLKNKKILVRVDFNIENFKEIGTLLKHPRIKKTLPTINFLLKAKPKQIIVISHRGQPRGRDAKLSLRPVYWQLRRIYKNLAFADRPDNLGNAPLVLVENIRFFKGETENNVRFGKKLASLADIYVNEAFSMSHRHNASVVQVPKYVRSFAGFLFEEELKNLAKLFSPKHPYGAVLGGAKISTKLPLLKRLIKQADCIILGGALANSALSNLGFEIGRSLAEKNIRGLKSILKNRKVMLPADFYVLSQGRKQKRFLGNLQKNDCIYDIGPLSLVNFFRVLRGAKTIIWNGPVGLFEDKRFSNGTFILACYLAGLRGFRVVGGGETLMALEQTRLLKKFDFVSTAGGAMLEFLAGKRLPGIEALHLIKH